MYYFNKYKEKEFEYLYQMKKDCFKWYVEEIYGPWKDEFQMELFKKFIKENQENIKIIKHEKRTIGLFTNYVNKNNESVIDLFYIDKNYQAKGIGKKILQKQLNIDKENKRSTILKVYKRNPARFLYEKVGFEVYEENDTHYKMRRNI